MAAQRRSLASILLQPRRPFASMSPPPAAGTVNDCVLKVGFSVSSTSKGATDRYETAFVLSVLGALEGRGVAASKVQPLQCAYNERRKFRRSCFCDGLSA